jgi:hypothetical protein
MGPEEQGYLENIRMLTSGQRQRTDEEILPLIEQFLGAQKRAGSFAEPFVNPALQPHAGGGFVGTEGMAHKIDPFTEAMAKVGRGEITSGQRQIFGTEKLGPYYSSMEEYEEGAEKRELASTFKKNLDELKEHGLMASEAEITDKGVKLKFKAPEKDIFAGMGDMGPGMGVSKVVRKGVTVEPTPETERTRDLLWQEQDRERDTAATEKWFNDDPRRRDLYEILPDGALMLKPGAKKMMRMGDLPVPKPGIGVFNRPNENTLDRYATIKTMWDVMDFVNNIESEADGINAEWIIGKLDQVIREFYGYQ